MKVYCGIPGPPQRAVVIVGGKLHELRGDGALSWKGKTDPGALRLAKAILLDALGPVGAVYATRWRWRVVAKWQPEKAWSVTIDDIKREVADVERIEQETAADRARMSLAPPLIDNEAGIGVSGRRIEWDATPEITRNPNITRRST